MFDPSDGDYNVLAAVIHPDNILAVPRHRSCLGQYVPIQWEATKEDDCLVKEETREQCTKYRDSELKDLTTGDLQGRSGEDLPDKGGASGESKDYRDKDMPVTTEDLQRRSGEGDELQDFGGEDMQDKGGAGAGLKD